MSLDLEHLRQWVGREHTLVDELSLFPARALAGTLDRRNAPQAGDALPPGWQWLYFLDTPRASETGADGHPKLDPALDSFLPPSPLPRRMWAAGSLQIEQPLKLGTPARKRSVIQSIDTKSGKSGTLLFVNLEHTLSQNDQLCIREEQNLVYRELPEGPAPLPAGEKAPLAAEWSQTITPDPVLLFRYSALTYNGHRIHYDRSYATSQEFYPALVVHGPLLATLLLELIQQRLPGAALRSFKFKAQRPSFDTHPFTVNAKRDGDRLKLWTADHEGFLCVSAEATLA